MSKPMHVRIDQAALREADRRLAAIPIELRGKTLQKAVRKAITVMAREARKRAPKPGHEGDEPGVIPTAKSIRSQTWVNPDSVRGRCRVAGVPAAYSLALEYGHELWVGGKKTGGTVKERPFFRPAIDTTKSEQQKTIIDTLRAEIGSLGK